ncbi:MAG TPA: medium chain dehydrogenase/reductase family protein [Candidatus Dormibacteraeota bacterium]|nr:medium chain dehydrogenase/reductase family protein [Candidatus Dormibacteraeota bacterium]
MRYRHIVVRQIGGPEVLQVVEDEIPAPRTQQALVKILAADVGFSDVNIRRGRYPGAPRPPFTPGYALIGAVDQVGPETSGLEVGQLVAALTFVGAYSQYIVLPAKELFPVPGGVDPAEAVTLVLNYVAAYQMLHRVAHASRGQRILVHGAAGGVGTAFLELGRLAELEMYGTASSAKHRLVNRLGATAIDYKTEDFVERIAALSAGVGVDAVFDPMGSAHLKKSAKALRSGGALVAYGYYEAARRGTSAVSDVLSQYLRMWLWSLPPRRVRAAFYDTRPTKKKHPDWYREDLERLLEWLRTGDLRPVIAARLPLEDVVRAHRQVEHAEVQGRLVLIPNP